MTTFPDERLAALDVLREVAPSEATYGTDDIDDFPVTNVPDLPYAAVKLDDTSVRYPISATAALRVLIWDESEFLARARAWRILAALVGYRGNASVGNFRPELGPRAVTDPDTGRPFAFFTVRARLRPQP